MYLPSFTDETIGVGVVCIPYRSVFPMLVFCPSILARCATYPSSYSHRAYVLNKVVIYCMFVTSLSL